MSVARLCQGCKEPLSKGSHFNRKRCEPCAEALRRKPSHSLSPRQVNLARTLRQVCSDLEICSILKCSRASLRRLARDEGFSLALPRYDDALIRCVTRAYEQHGRSKTQKMFPGVRVRSIVERRPHKPRQIRWKEREIVAAARMAGLLSFEQQAELFHRPRAKAGSIRSLWNKRFKTNLGQLHGCSRETAKYIALPECPMVPRRAAIEGSKGPLPVQWIVLWCDLKDWMRPSLPPFISDAVTALAEFQCWLYQTQKPKSRILEILRHQEGGDLASRWERRVEDLRARRIRRSL